MTHPPSPSLPDAFRAFFKIGVYSFGGPAAQIALMHRVLVEEERWLSEKQFLSALSFCMMLPGPEAMQLATYAGWRLHGTIGGLIAGVLFVLPGALVIFALAALYALFGSVPLVDTLFLGVQAAAVAIVLGALMRLSQKALQGRAHWVIAGLAFVGIFCLNVPFPLIILIAGLYGAYTARPAEEGAEPFGEQTKLGHTLMTLVIGVAIWVLPVLAVDVLLDAPILKDIGIFFSKLAVVTFGGAYAVLAYMAQDVVTNLGWLSANEMMDGLGLAETTPGPLILVTQFVGFLAGYHQQGLWLGFLAGLVTLWVTFVPCFLWIFLGAPYIERISGMARLSAALSAITAAVVGVILNLSLWFALHVIFAQVIQSTQFGLTFWIPEITSLRFEALILIALAAYLLMRRNLEIGWVLLVCALGAVILQAV
jgi:chromate transporter